MPVPKDPEKHELYRQRLSAAQKKRWERPGEREKTSETTKAAMARPEVKAKMHKIVQAQWDNPETRATLEASFHKRWERPEEHEKTSRTTQEAMIEMASTPEFREIRIRAGLKRWDNTQRRLEASERMLQQWQDPEYIQSWAASMSVVHRYKGRSSIEVIIASILSTLEVEYEEQKRIGRYSADFYIPGKNLVVECDGGYWHSERKPGAIEKDARKDAYLKAHGYALLRLAEEQIRKNDLSTLYDAIA